MTAYLDTNILVLHYTGDPPDLARRATRYLEQADELLLPDLILAELAYVLGSYYSMARGEVVAALRATLSIPAVRVDTPVLLQRVIELYRSQRLDFADAYLVACAERTGVNAVASFDRAIDRVGTVRREEPAGAPTPPAPPPPRPPPPSASNRPPPRSPRVAPASSPPR